MCCLICISCHDTASFFFPRNKIYMRRKEITKWHLHVGPLFWQLFAKQTKNWCSMPYTERKMHFTHWNNTTGFLWERIGALWGIRAVNLSGRIPLFTLISALYCFSEQKERGGGGLEIKQSPHTVRCVRRGDASRAHHWTTKPHRKTQCQTRAALARELLRVVLQREEGRSSFSRNPPDRPSCFSEGVVERKRGLRRWRDLGMHAHGYGWFMPFCSWICAQKVRISELSTGWTLRRWFSLCWWSWLS